MRISIVFAVCSTLLLCSCATLTEQQQYELENKRVVAMERYERAETACQRMGGVMELAPKRWGERSHRDYASAACVRY